MDYKVLALKWRPQRFGDLVGQDHVSSVLQGALRQERLAQAYLFSGPRGCGKTTTARLLAKVLNCENPEGEEPCGSCNSCQGILAGSSLAVQEIDAASNRSIEDIRRIREEVGLSALEGRHRIYIIDEAHQITGDAANALLKTLEEPPPGVVFVLATTELEKIIPTIRSRCQCFSFRLLGADEIAGHLDQILSREKIPSAEGVTLAIARKADGSMRDGLTLLDQVIASIEGEISMEQVIEILGLPRFDHFFQLTEACLERDGAAAIRAMNQVLDSGVSPRDFALGLSGHFRNLLLLKHDPALLEGEMGREEREACQKYAGDFKAEDLLYLTRLLGDRADQIRYASRPRVLLEALVIELARFESRVMLSEVMALLKNSAVSGGMDSGGRKRESHPAKPAPAPNEKKKEVSPAQYPLSGDGFRAAWPHFVSVVKESNMLKGNFLEKASPGEVTARSFSIRFARHFHGFLDSPADKTLLQERFLEVFGEKREVRLDLDSAPEARDRVSSEKAEGARRKQDRKDYSGNDLVQGILEKFDGEIIES
ncbi:MAG: DNA polymerase III subunit gamma/tau [Candidatus Krumholzibacteria bacterium]|nr:DNA polymerase III subunit gamma/tau [Candidatus Krumholzibacteria bacterium]MDP6669324.1 DNA polymerase III subunit gamma/tau [Candidatus Krumholzibacteria bacterium]